MNADKLRECFSRSLGIPQERVTDNLEYNTLKEWDSIGHMALVSAETGRVVRYSVFSTNHTQVTIVTSWLV